MKVKILQADIKCRYKFMSLKFAKENGFTLNDYKEVFSGEVDAENLEDVFVIFNMDNRPNGRTMHSLSMSDIVINDEGMWYCDTFGLKNLLNV